MAGCWREPGRRSPDFGPWDPHLSTWKTLYVEISRARDRAELPTDDRAALKKQIKTVTGERIAAPAALGIGDNRVCPFRHNLNSVTPLNIGIYSSAPDLTVSDYQDSCAWGAGFRRDQAPRLSRSLR